MSAIYIESISHSVPTDKPSQGFLSLARARSTASPATLHFGIDSSSLGSRARAARLRARIVDNAGPAAAAAVASRPPQKISPAIEPETLRLELRTVPPPAPRQKTVTETLATESQDEKITPVQSTGVEKNQAKIRHSMLDGSLEPAKDQESTNSSTDTAPDPLRLFGLFPPPALRHVQRSFEHAVVSPVAELVRVMAEMRRLEDVIQKEMAERGT